MSGLDAPATPLLDRIDSPQDLRSLDASRLDELAAEIRSHLISSVSRTGGHLGPNLGVVELTIALHRVFDSPRDTLVFDTGHQAYVHKLLTGRRDFTHLRQEGGLSGYPSRSESEHDVVESSHASSSLSWADGISREKRRRGDRTWTVAVIGDGALTGGMAWEALNNVAAAQDRRLMIVVNDNGRSYAPTIGGLAHHLDALRTSEHYERTLAWGRRTLLSLGEPGRAAYEALHGLKTGMKDALIPQAMFEDLGLKYLGPVDGHDETALEQLFQRARTLHEPVLVHVITEKGRGYTPAEEDIADRFHAVGRIHPETGLPVAPARFGWTSVFADEIVRIARDRDDVVALTAAMMRPVGLGPLSEAFPERVIDVGIAEQHAVAAAAGMAFEGAHPVVALYATFLNRGVDQVVMDLALHRAPVTLVLDRAGVTGDDGASHNGVWDMAFLATVPRVRIAAPRDEATLRALLRDAVAVDDGPTVVRYRKGELPAPMPAVRTVGGVDVLAEHGVGADGVAEVCLVAMGAFAEQGLEAGRLLAEEGMSVRVVDPGWVMPVPVEGLAALSEGARIIVTLEDGAVDGGIGWAVRDALGAAGVTARVVTLGVPKEFPGQASRGSLLHRWGLDAEGVVARVRGELA